MNEIIKNRVNAHDFADIFSSDDERLIVNKAAESMMYEIFANSDYINDPKLYVLTWIEFRGDEEDFQIPEDDLLSIFKNAYL
jgi:hypothetical protein